LQLNRSKLADVKDVLGEPSSEATNGDGVELRYQDADGSQLIFYFAADGLWTSFTVQSHGGSSVVPSCLAPDGGWFERPDGGYYDRSRANWRDAGAR
jgi:hypothetical protein